MKKQNPFTNNRVMDIHTFHNKRKIGSTDISDFTDFQGIGRDPLYRRYANVKALVDKIVDKRFVHFLAIPDFDPARGEINWYVDIWEETPERLKDLSGEKRARYEKIKGETLEAFKANLQGLSLEDRVVMEGVLRHINEDFIFCSDGKVFVVAWGMAPDTDRHIAVGELVHDAPNPVKVTLTFLACDNGRFTTGESCVCTVPQGSVITADELPAVKPFEGFEFSGYYPNPVGQTAVSPMEFRATYRRIPVVPPPLSPAPPADSETKDANPIPVVEPDRPKRKRPWWWWLLWILLLALVVLGILALCGIFDNCSGHENEKKEKKKGADTEEITDTPGNVVIGDGDYGPVRDIELTDGRLPEEELIVPPPYSEPGEAPEVVRGDEGLPAIDERLVLLLLDSSRSLDELAEAFKRVYPGDEYRIIGLDKYVGSITVRVPSDQRQTIASEIESRIPDINFVAIDDVVYELVSVGQSEGPKEEWGWHLTAVNAQGGWNITQGSRDVVVAVVDDGMDLSHPMFKGRIVKPYNVFSRDGNLTTGVGHGTMVAGLAVGSLEYRSRGVAGIAPECRLMPVQVADGENMTMSSIAGGIMYAVNNGADVVNVSVGLNVEHMGYQNLPPEKQREVAATTFKGVEKLFTKVCSAAEAKNCIIVFAAGNNDIISLILPENRPTSAIVVGAVDKQRFPTHFTNYGEGTHLSAPGLNISSSYPVGDFNAMDGTSFSAPIVTGTIALMRSLKADLTWKQADDILYRTGKEVYGPLPPMVYIPDALMAVKNGDFSRGPKRDYVKVPEKVVSGERKPLNSWIVPIEGSFPDKVEVIDPDRYFPQNPGADKPGSYPVSEIEIPEVPDVNYADLLDRLNELIRQRDILNRQIDELQQQLPSP